MVKKTIGMSLVALAAAAVFGTAVYGEGYWTSSISGAYTGFESRLWTDRNTDGASTIVRFDGCTRAGGFGTNATIETRRVVNNWPDDFLGNQTLYCATSASGNWGDVRSGDYRFRVNKINGASSGYQLWVRYVKTSY